MGKIDKYQIIYADPPWRYEHAVSNSRKIENQYPTMTLDDIKAIDIPAEKDSVLYMWVTAPKVAEAIGVLDSWGFNYRTCAVWDKKVIGMGYWFRNQHELLFVAVRGNFSPPPSTQRISSMITSPKTAHSSKPDYVKQMIAEWYPDKTKLEMFARHDKASLFHQDAQWHIWGNEVESDIKL